MNRGHAGQALIEFALTLPILLILLLGVLDGGRAVLATIALSGAVRDGARVGALAYPEAGWEGLAIQRTRESAGGGLDVSSLQVTAQSQVTGDAIFIAVEASYRFQPITPLLSELTGPLDLPSSSRMLTR